VHKWMPSYGIANTFVNRVFVKSLCAVVLPLCALWAAASAWQDNGQRTPRPQSHLELPQQWQGAPLRVLALSEVEQRFAQRFPGQIARMTDGQQVLVLRAVDQPTRMLHPAADCYRGLGYRISAQQLWHDEQQALWRCFVACACASALWMQRGKPTPTHRPGFGPRKWARRRGRGRPSPWRRLCRLKMISIYLLISNRS
jgi:hypothetical protein